MFLAHPHSSKAKSSQISHVIYDFAQNGAIINRMQRIVNIASQLHLYFIISSNLSFEIVVRWLEYYIYITYLANITQILQDDNKQQR